MMLAPLQKSGNKNRHNEPNTIRKVSAKTYFKEEMLLLSGYSFLLSRDRFSYNV